MSLKFNDNGFWFKESQISWEDVEKIHSYKIDLITIDEIILEISTKDKINRFPESEENWFEFANFITEKFGLESFEWYFHIMHPAFQENRTLLFEKDKA